jgi:outer membrane protein assembly factor BamB
MEPLTAADPGTVGGYRLRARLGSGGMGKVYLGYSPAGRAVAIKVVHRELSRDAEFLRRFRMEVAAAQEVSGLYTAPAVATGLDDDPPWLATTFIAAPTLHDAVSEGGTLPASAVWRLGAGLAEALAAVHACGLVHRDLKPTNVLLAEDGPRVIDFGVSRALDGTVLTQSGMTLGTPPFMSPEQAEGTPTGVASDVFSFGSVLCFAATGSPPFGDGSVPAVLYRVVNRPPVLDRMPAALRGIVAACLAKDPAGRPSVSELARLLATGAVSAVGDEWPAEFWPVEVELRIRNFRAGLSEGLAGTLGPAPDSERESAPTLTRERAMIKRPPPPDRALAPVPAAVPAAVPAPVPRRPRRIPRGTRVSGTPLWRFKSEPVEKTVATPGVLYAALRGGRVCALDAGNGKRLWRRPLPGNPWQLAADETNVYVLGDTGTYTLNGAIGQTTWQHRADADAGAGAGPGAGPGAGLGTGTGLGPDPVRSHPARSHPVAAGGGAVYLTEEAAIIALTAELGRLVWRSPVAGVISLARADRMLYATATGTDEAAALIALDAASGGPAWRRIMPYQNPCGLVTADGVVYVSGHTPDGWLLAVDAATGRQLWEYLSAATPSVAAAEGIAYVARIGAEIRTYHVRSGMPGWVRELPSAATAGPVVVSGSVCVGLDTGELCALDAASGEELWCYPLGAAVTDLISAGRTVYAVADSAVYAFVP